MTCIVGLVDEKGTVYVGGDAAAVSGLFTSPRKDPKVFIKDDFIYGYTSSFRMGDIIQYSFEAPKFNERVQTLNEYMRTDFVDELRSCFKNKGYASISDNSESAGCFIVGTRGRLFVIEEDYQVGEPLEEYYSVGCGNELALGSLHTTNVAFHAGNVDAETRLTLALAAASHFSGGVRPPFTILSLPQSTKKRRK
jgi:hypothetical protein